MQESLQVKMFSKVSCFLWMFSNCTCGFPGSWIITRFHDRSLYKQILVGNTCCSFVNGIYRLLSIIKYHRSIVQQTHVVVNRKTEQHKLSGQLSSTQTFPLFPQFQRLRMRSVLAKHTIWSHHFMIFTIFWHFIERLNNLLSEKIKSDNQSVLQLWFSKNIHSLTDRCISV